MFNSVLLSCLPGVQSHPSPGPTEGQRDPGEAEGTLRESNFFMLSLYEVNALEDVDDLRKMKKG